MTWRPGGRSAFSSLALGGCWRGELTCARSHARANPQKKADEPAADDEEGFDRDMRTLFVAQVLAPDALPAGAVARVLCDSRGRMLGVGRVAHTEFVII